LRKVERSLSIKKKKENFAIASEVRPDHFSLERRNLKTREKRGDILPFFIVARIERVAKQGEL